MVFYHDVVKHSLIPESPLFVEEKLFWNHIDALEKRYSIIALSALAPGSPLPPRPLVLTFDGYSRNFLSLARRLSERRIGALFYLMTEPIMTGRSHWHQKLFYVCRNAKTQDLKIELEGKVISFHFPGRPRENLGVSNILLNRIEKLQEKHAVIQQIARKFDINLEEFDANNRPLMQDEVKEMSSLPGIEIGSHSHTHPRFMDGTRALYELQTSKKHLEEWTGKPVIHYAYPEGLNNEAALVLLPKLGYRTATITGNRVHDFRSLEEWPYGIPRFMLSNAPVSVAVGHLTGWGKALDILIAFRRKRLRKRFGIL